MDTVSYTCPLWAGLGHYAQARCLHQCAQLVAQALNGVFPNTVGALVSLPGIGRAIISIAFVERATILDRNVKRALARHHTSRAGQKKAPPL